MSAALNLLVIYPLNEIPAWIFGTLTALLRLVQLPFLSPAETQDAAAHARQIETQSAEAAEAFDAQVAAVDGVLQTTPLADTHPGVYVVIDLSSYQQDLRATNDRLSMFNVASGFHQRLSLLVKSQPDATVIFQQRKEAAVVQPREVEGLMKKFGEGVRFALITAESPREALAAAQIPQANVRTDNFFVITRDQEAVFEGLSDEQVVRAPSVPHLAVAFFVYTHFKGPKAVFQRLLAILRIPATLDGTASERMMRALRGLIMA